jgi:hypothetical protein
VGRCRTLGHTRYASLSLTYSVPDTLPALDLHAGHGPCRGGRASAATGRPEAIDPSMLSAKAPSCNRIGHLCASHDPDPHLTICAHRPCMTLPEVLLLRWALLDIYSKVRLSGVLTVLSCVLTLDLVHTHTGPGRHVVLLWHQQRCCCPVLVQPRPRAGSYGGAKVGGKVGLCRWMTRGQELLMGVP